MPILASSQLQLSNHIESSLHPLNDVSSYSSLSHVYETTSHQDCTYKWAESYESLTVSANLLDSSRHILAGILIGTTKHRDGSSYYSLLVRRPSWFRITE
ncbi:uncharacterized protein ARMOST_11228 [Armillaria ostoyae]|uniref:Uncharacterized protein n=1 Tax=Armillaria ostoyae TaxID=47428 RepID=A0A284RGI8_ARMOS|nr:uncharacterized protein ARMOST_11228 [Armillaria ostoyae]